MLEGLASLPLSLIQQEEIRQPVKTRSLNPGQKRAFKVLRGSQLHTCLAGGSRSGKTALITRTMLSRGIRAPGSRHLFTRFRANAVRSSVWLDTLPKVIDMWFPGLVLKPYRQDGFEELPNGSQLWFGGLDEADRIEKILGQEYATIYAGECSQIPYSSIAVLRTRLAQVCPLENRPGHLPLRGYYDLNPTTTKHWTHAEFVEHRDPVTRMLLDDPENYQIVFINPEDNAENLDPRYLDMLRRMPKVYRDRFYRGEYVKAIEGALWTPDLLEVSREDQIMPHEKGKKLEDFQRIVVAIDPSGAQSKNDVRNDDIGIVTAGKRRSNIATVLEDATMKGGPSEWGRAAVASFKKWKADLIVAEANYGGAMVSSTIKAVDPNVPVKLVNASRGKIVRAEPVSALYNEGKVTHAGRFPEMEEELMQFALEGYKGDRSPNRADAAIWAITDLMLGDASNYTLAFVR